MFTFSKKLFTKNKGGPPSLNQSINSMRNDNTLSNLAADQLDDLFAWLTDSTYAEVEKRVAQPSPEGFGLKVHLTTLRRFYHERLRAECDAALADDTDPFVTGRLVVASDKALAYSTYSLARSQARPELLNQLSRALHRRQSLDLKRAFLEVAHKHAELAEARVEIERQRLKLAEITFRFNASKEAAVQALKIKETLHTKGPDLEQKVWQVSDLVFGPSPDRHKFASRSPNPAMPDRSNDPVPPSQANPPPQ